MGVYVILTGSDSLERNTEKKGDEPTKHRSVRAIRGEIKMMIVGAFVMVFGALIAGAVIYIIWYSKNRFEAGDYDYSRVLPHQTTSRIKDTGSGHGFHTPYGGASSNGAASSYAIRARKK